MSEINLAAGGYRYCGTLADETPGRKPYRRSPLAACVLETLAGFGGEATTVEVRHALEASGTVLSAPRQVNDVLGGLAKAVSPAVTAVGDPRGGRGKAQRWRLGNAP